MSRTLPIVILTLNRKLPSFSGAKCTGPGLVSAEFDPETADIRIVSSLPSIDNPGFLAVHPRHSCVYAVTEMHDWEEGVITSVGFNPDTLKLTYQNKQPSLGNCTSHCSLDREGKYLLITNYSIGAADMRPGMSVVSLPIRSDGSLAPATSFVKLSGSGPVSSRQEQAHAHCIFATPNNRHVIVADLGSDCLRTIPFDPSTGVFSEHGIENCYLPAGSGPRHFFIHPDGHIVYVLNELAGTLFWCSLGQGGSLAITGSISTRHAGATGRNDSSDLAMTPDGCFIYAANRGDDTVAIFPVQSDGSLEQPGHQSVQGHWPRNLGMDPDGQFLLIANQYSGNISVFSIDNMTGKLKHRRNIDIDSPMCISFPQAYNSLYARHLNT